MSSVAVEKKSNLVVSEFSNVILKSFNVFSREGKATLYFVEFVDAETFETTGEMMLLKKNFSEADAFEMAKLEKKKVRATIRVSPFNGRSSITCLDIQAL